MRVEKLNLTKEYVARLNASPFFIVTSFQGLNVGQLTELRKRLYKVGAEFHVVKNSMFKIAAKEAGIHFVAGGHYATERIGIQALTERLARQFELEWEFIDLPNPV